MESSDVIVDRGNVIFALATVAVLFVLPICCLVIHYFRQAMRQRGGHEVDQGAARSIYSTSMEVFSGTTSPDISSISSNETFEMLNKTFTIAKGLYIHLPPHLFPS